MPVTASLDLDVEVLILSPLVTYSVLQTEGTRLDVLLGARYLKETVGFDFALGGGDIGAEDSFNAWDGIVGLTGKTVLSKNRKWYLSYYGDIGAGDSDKTWQLAAAVNYRFKKFVGLMGYRHKRWDFDEKDDGVQLAHGQYLSGPMLGAKFIF